MRYYLSQFFDGVKAKVGYVGSKYEKSTVTLNVLKVFDIGSTGSKVSARFRRDSSQAMA